ncbi:MAG: sugar phosphate isomerase/epimerase [Chloroflexi bacterium]|nr:sugar phosphate isomerase/epimerase [Chloroflexota bacterium]
MNWDISLSTGLFLGQRLPDVLEPVRKAGFRFIQISGFSRHFDFNDPGHVLEVRRRLDALGMRATSLHLPYSNRLDPTLLNDVDRGRVVREMKRAVDALAELGGQAVVFHAGSADEKARDQALVRLTQAARSAIELEEHCHQRGVLLAIEDMLSHLVGGRREELQWVLLQLPRENVGVCLDTGHSFLARDLAGRMTQFGPRLVMVHAHDNHRVYDDHLPPGEGEIPWIEFLDGLAETGYQGEIVLEVNERAGEPDLLRRVRESADFLRRCARGKPYDVNL